jgi:toxin-antitoxin system PIN domain toxin
MNTVTSRPYLLDLNVLIALSWPQHVHHARAHAWFDSLQHEWATTPVTEAGYVRLTTTSAVVGEAVSMSSALAALAAVRAAPGHVFLPDSSTLAEPSIDLSRVATSRQVTDAHLVNLAAGAGAVLATLDRGIEQWLLPNDRVHVMVLPA